MTAEESLSRIHEGDGDLRAWVSVRPSPPLGKGPLDGVPFGVKDIFDVAGLPCEWGSPVLAGRMAEGDCSLVSMLRERGAVMMGKTHTTAFACFDPAPTRNPRAPGRTPGGSSSGSAAAVAAGMVPFAIGSQTQGSVVRPASYCGVVGFKPTLGLLPLDRTMPFAPSLDTAGLFTQSAAGMMDLWRRMGFVASAAFDGRIAAMPPDLGDPEPEMRAAYERAIAQLGARVVEPPKSFRGLVPIVRRIQDIEGARSHRAMYERHGSAVGAKFAALMERGLAASEVDLQRALAALAAATRDMAEFHREWPVIVSAAAPGPPPLLEEGSTGDPRMNGAWTGLGSPVLSIPMPFGGESGPLGLQMAAAPGQDALLLAAALAVENEWL